MGWRDVDFEIGSEGPKLRWSLFSRRPTIEGVKEKLRKKLRIRPETARLAEYGIPPPEDLTPSAKQQQIREEHQGWANEIDRQAKQKLDKKAADAAALGTDIVDSDYTQAAAQHRSRLAEIRTRFPASVRPLMKRKVKAESALRAFDHVNDTADQPTARSAIEFIGTTIITACVEALFNGLMFKEQMGYVSAVGFAFGIGASLAVLGTCAGIGWARIKRKERLRRWGGIALMFAGIVIAALFLLAMTHYRTALAAGATNPAAAAQQSFSAAPFAPAFDMSLLPYLFVNFACLWIVAIKAASLFGWLDLRRRRKAAERTTKAVDNCLSDSLGRCDDARATVTDDVDGIVSHGRDNANTAKSIRTECRAILSDRDEWREAAQHSYSACEQEYRETVQSVHPSGTYQPRFALPPQPLQTTELTIDPAVDTAVTASEARSVSLRDQRPALLATLNAETDDTERELHELLETIEADVRLNRSGAPTLRVVN